MARSKTTPTQPAPQLDGAHTALEADSARHGELITHRERDLAYLDQHYGFDGAYDRDRMIAIGREAYVSLAERYYSLGRACLLLKEHEPHGAFGPALEEMGIPQDIANRAMAIVRKFQGDGPRKQLVDRFAVTKLMALIHEPDEALDALTDGGTIAGKTLDEIDTMSVRELKETLRRERKDHADELAARDDIVARKDEKLRHLETRARGLRRKPANERALAMLPDLELAVVDLLKQGDLVKAAIAGVFAIYEETGDEIDKDIQDRLKHAATSAETLGTGLAHLINA